MSFLFVQYGYLSRVMIAKKVSSVKSIDSEKVTSHYTILHWTFIELNLFTKEL